MELGSIPKSINVLPGPDFQTDIATVRDALAPLGTPQIQTIGSPDENDFMIRLEEEEGAEDFDTTIAESVITLLADEYGDGTVLIRQTDYVGAQFSSNLAQQTVYLSVLALLLILAYTWFRFRLGYAVSAITALVHDSLFIFAFIGVTGLEFSTATIAAVLTIIGYSLNDTIVIFDRIRENTGILRNEEFRRIVDTSVTQSLSRTLMTSVTTLLAVAAIYIFATGTIQDFALSMIVGVLIGTYSSIFVASPILIGWTNRVTTRRKAKDAERFGSREVPATPATSGAARSDSAEPTVAPEGDAAGGERPIPKYERKLKGKRKKNK
jgi:preprotein translocase subunit SecF